MNPKFYALPQEKQRSILNAGFHVFSQNTYKKSPMSEIAEAAGISKVLLFHYFQNKKDPEVNADIQKSMGQYLNAHAAKKLAKPDPEGFIPGIDLQMMYKEIYWASGGCLWDYIQRGIMDVNAMEKDFRTLLDFWKKVYLRKEQEDLKNEPAWCNGENIFRRQSGSGKNRPDPENPSQAAGALCKSKQPLLQETV